MKPRPDLYRCVLAVDGKAVIHASAPGRGAWLCGRECLDAAVSRRGFDRAWRSVAPASVGQDLRCAFEELRVSWATSGEDQKKYMGADDFGDATHETMLLRAKG